MSSSSPDVAGLFETLRGRLKTERDAADFFNRTIAELVAPHHLTRFWGDRLLTLDKSAGFMEEEAFRTAFESIRGSHAYDQYAGPQSIAWRLHTLVWGARCGLRLPGDFVECGVFKGDMAWMMASLIDLGRYGKTFYLYDSFEGFSRKYSSPEDFPLNPGFLDFADREYKIPGLYESVRERFASLPEVRVIKGVLPDVLATEAPQRIAFMHVDLNSPAAEIGVLERLFDRVVPGGVVVFDDYGWHLFRKQKDAEDAFMAERGYAILELPTGQGLVVKR